MFCLTCIGQIFATLSLIYWPACLIIVCMYLINTRVIQKKKKLLLEAMTLTIHFNAFFVIFVLLFCLDDTAATFCDLMMTCLPSYQAAGCLAVACQQKIHKYHFQCEEIIEGHPKALLL